MSGKLAKLKVMQHQWPSIQLINNEISIMKAKESAIMANQYQRRRNNRISSIIIMS